MLLKEIEATSAALFIVVVVQNVQLLFDGFI